MLVDINDPTLTFIYSTGCYMNVWVAVHLFHKYLLSTYNVEAKE